MSLCCYYSQIIAVNVIIDITEHGGTQLTQHLEDGGRRDRVQGKPGLYITPCLKKKKKPNNLLHIFPNLKVFPWHAGDYIGL